MTGVLESPRRLERSDDKSGFSSGAEELDAWLQRYAFQNQKANNAVTYVTMLDGKVVGYYAIAVAGYARSNVPENLAKGRPTEIPSILLARLAVDERAKGRGVGAALLRDALVRSEQISESVGAAALLIHCRDEDARSFYLANGDFIQSPVEPLHLMLSMRTITTMLRG